MKKRSGTWTKTAPIITNGSGLREKTSQETMFFHDFLISNIVKTWGLNPRNKWWQWFTFAITMTTIARIHQLLIMNQSEQFVASASRGKRYKRDMSKSWKQESELGMPNSSDSSMWKAHFIFFVDHEAWGTRSPLPQKNSWSWWCPQSYGNGHPNKLMFPVRNGRPSGTYRRTHFGSLWC